jgi:hypothetical protein
MPGTATWGSSGYGKLHQDRRLSGVTRGAGECRCTWLDRPAVVCGHLPRINENHDPQPQHAAAAHRQRVRSSGGHRLLLTPG